MIVLTRDREWQRQRAQFVQGETKKKRWKRKKRHFCEHRAHGIVLIKVRRNKKQNEEICNRRITQIIGILELLKKKKIWEMEMKTKKQIVIHILRREINLCFLRQTNRQI